VETHLELKRYQDQLESLVEIRTNEIKRSNERLQEETLERLDAEKKQRHLETHLLRVQKMEAIGTIAAGIAHDFNNIISIILGNTELAFDDVSEENPAHTNLEEIRVASLRARDIVQSLLSFSRETGKESRQLQIGPVIEQSLNLFKSAIPRKIRIIQDIEPEVGFVRTDPTQIHQILTSLCSNAVHAMEQRGGVLSVSLKAVRLSAEKDGTGRGLPKGRYARLTVSDTGEGMEEHVARRVFDPYYTTKEVGKGSGMGLAVVQGIIKKHGGEVLVKSAKNEGSIFDVFLPIAEIVERDGQDEPTRGEKTGGHILLVDDEEPIVRMEAVMLQRLGYHVTVFTESLEALETFQQNSGAFDLVITDLTMPKLSGEKLAAEIKTTRPEIPIILCTGHDEVRTTEGSRAKDIDAILPKPAEREAFVRVIQQMLK